MIPHHDWIPICERVWKCRRCRALRRAIPTKHAPGRRLPNGAVTFEPGPGRVRRFVFMPHDGLTWERLAGRCQVWPVRLSSGQNRAGK